MCLLGDLSNLVSCFLESLLKSWLMIKSLATQKEATFSPWKEGILETQFTKFQFSYTARRLQSCKVTQACSSPLTQMDFKNFQPAGSIFTICNLSFLRQRHARSLSLFSPRADHQIFTNVFTLFWARPSLNYSNEWEGISRGGKGLILTSIGKNAPSA